MLINHQDLQHATSVAWRMVTQFGMSEKLGPVDYNSKFNALSSETKAIIEQEVQRTLSESYERCRRLLTAKRRELDLLAQALVDYETLDKAEVEKVIRGEKLEGRIPIPKDKGLAVPAPRTGADESPVPPEGDPPSAQPPPGNGGLVAGKDSQS